MEVSCESIEEPVIRLAFLSASSTRQIHAVLLCTDKTSSSELLEAINSMY